MVTSQEKVSALPTKAFFVDMLTKDVSLSSAIMDLIDNCVDGALRLRGDGSLEGLIVKINVNEKEFLIEDNCGGIPLEIARRYAFRFGRPDNAPPVDNSVGLFGVGMKRAMFKLGREFEVQAKFDKTSFSVTVDVEAWQKEELWEFPLVVERDAGAVSERDSGTKIRVLRLHHGVAAQFSSSLFVSRLQNEIRTKHQTYLRRGLTIQVNGNFLVASVIEFAYIPNVLKPAYEEIHNNGVTVKLFSGVGQGGPDARADAGWYVYCNGRMVVKADQTELTGWGSLGTDRVPRYHHQFARFRGCAFFNSIRSQEFPWNTTKDGLDVEADLYHTVKIRMATHMRPVITFLNRLDDELDRPDEDKRVLTNMLSRATYAAVESLPDWSRSDMFFYKPPPPTPRPPQTSRISFSRLKSEVDALKRYLRVTTNRDVGERTFDWYLKNEYETDD